MPPAHLDDAVCVASPSSHHQPSVTHGQDEENLFLFFLRQRADDPGGPVQLALDPAGKPGRFFFFTKSLSDLINLVDNPLCIIVRQGS